MGTNVKNSEEDKASGPRLKPTFEKALQIGACGYIVKPFNASEVMINISNALRRRRLGAVESDLQ